MYDFTDFRKRCLRLDDEDLQVLYQRYVRQVAQGTTGQVVGVGLAVFTCGLSLLGTAYSAAEMTNAAIKVDIIREEMQRRKKKHLLNTRARDVFGGVGLGSVGLVTAPASHLAMQAVSAAAASGGTFYSGRGCIVR